MNTPPRVIIDARMIGPIQHGIARYVGLMASGLQKIAQQKPLPYQPVFLVQPHVASVLKHLGIDFFETCETEIRFLDPTELFKLPALLRKLRADLYHSPSFSSIVASPCPWIVTVHDLNHLQYGDWAKKIYYGLFLRSFVRKAAAVLTVSEFSKQEIAVWADLDPARIEVVYNALDPRLGEPVPEEQIRIALRKHALQKQNYFFCLSNSKPHKNVAFLVDAYSDFRKQSGSGAASPLVLSMNEYKEVPGVRALGGLGEGEARALLAGARALLFPSLYEGFGLPPAEAAALGVPLVVSRIPPHGEGLQDLSPTEVTWVEPKDKKGWTESFSRAQQGQLTVPSPASRAKLLNRFTVKRLAEHMDRVYRGVLRV